MASGSCASVHVLKMKAYIDQLEHLEKTIMKLHGMFKKGGIKKKKVAPVKGKGKGKAIQPNPKPKTKGQRKARSDIP
ncbi:hypothetical protein OSB04_011667 [Centaurea solstitialis]|uniref:Uncharacterized protein n=1 Tax=Centaurea solstitialis TaxID=347529 RepID=A0AA38T9V9_9ASTR|nr:hypothetical protein OSB04_011667 [Centaurea solstitialis]